MLKESEAKLEEVAKKMERSEEKGEAMMAFMEKMRNSEKSKPRYVVASFSPEADRSLLLLLLLPDNRNEVSPLESPLLAARYLNHYIVILVIVIIIMISKEFYPSLSSSSSSPPSSVSMLLSSIMSSRSRYLKYCQFKICQDI